MGILRKSLLLAALVLTLLGTGNIVFGNSRLREYYTNLTERHTSLDTSSENRLINRIEYYRLVVHGGKWMLAVAALCFAGMIVTKEKPNSGLKN